MRHLVWISAIVLLLSAIGCEPREPAPPKASVSPQESSSVDEPPRVFVDIAPDGPQTDNSLRYVATYQKNGKKARFAIEFQADKNLEPQAGLRIRSGRGSFIADPKSENSELLSDLKPALAAHILPKQTIRVRQLPFTFVFLGENDELSPNGGLVGSATGKWVGAKLFLGPQQETEMFFNFEKPGGKAEFSMKDEEYGDALIKELAKVL